jgi:hypothetical protein
MFLLSFPLSPTPLEEQYKKNKGRNTENGTNLKKRGDNKDFSVLFKFLPYLQLKRNLYIKAVEWYVRGKWGRGRFKQRQKRVQQLMETLCSKKKRQFSGLSERGGRE